ncbi:MAG: fused MFS/spermidine synthase [Planctomycetes bacterium]|nr:fused MFS/spermidine synthase [Planctomycetota bacterium]
MSETPAPTSDRQSVAWFTANATVFVSSACMMVIELVAGRIIARHLGSSLYTWTSIIGVVLGGIAIGNYVGGVLADRFRPRPTLSLLFIFASATSALIVPANGWVGDWPLLWSFSWPWRVASHIASVFLLPSVILGTISPIVAKMALDIGRQRGRTIGSIYAWGVVGSILGTFATGFYLIAAFGTMTIVWTVAGVLAAMAVLYGAISIASCSWSAALIAGLVIAHAPWAWAREWGQAMNIRSERESSELFSCDTNYSYLRVVRTNDSPDTRAMYLDKLRHSELNLEEPDDLRYEYERTYAALTHRIAQSRANLRTLMIGGGGYVFPAYLARNWPTSINDVVEIDPAVTKAAFDHMGIAPSANIHPFHEDGRVFVDRKAWTSGADSAERYDLIYLDVFSDYSVPFQLTTLEFVRNIQRNLKPDGAYMMNLIDAFDHGRFLAAARRTLLDVFPHVYALTEGRPIEAASATRNTFILVCSNVPVDVANLGPAYRADCMIFPIQDEKLAELERRIRPDTLTDDYAPVENLVTTVVRDSAASIASSEWYRVCADLINRGKHEKAVSLLRARILADPTQLPIRMLLGKALLASGRIDEAVAHYTESLKVADVPGLHSALASAFAEQGQHADALPHREAAAQKDPKNSFNRLLWAQTLATLGKTDDAIVQLKAAIGLRPRYAEAYLLWGAILTASNQWNDAVDRFQQALALRPDFIDAWSRMGAVLLSAKRFDDAEHCFRKCVELNPKDADAQFNVGNSLYFAGKLEPAVEAYLAAARINPGFFNAYFNVAIIRESQGRLPEARSYCEQAIRAKPDDAVAKQLLQRIVDKSRRAAP